MFNNAIKISFFCVLITLFAGCSNSNTKQDLIDRAGAPLLSGLGDHSHSITTSQDGVQEYFDQGLVLAFAFNHAESIRSFKAAQTLDPSCAMCYWGEALARGPNINVTSNGKAVMSDEERIKAFEAALKAKDLMANSTPKEQAYITALSSRYDGDITSDRNVLDLTYAEAMERVVRTYPEDMDAASLYSEALMNTMPWNYWSDDGSPKPDTIKVISKLEEVLEKEPNHPLAIHLYIHAVEASSSPERAELAAERLGGLLP